MSMNVVVNGLMTNYQQVGSGKVVLCLHGWGDRNETFSKLVERLRHKHELLLLDLPGFGGTEPPPSAWGLNDYASFVAAWLKKIKAPKIYATIGHSFGGSVVIVAASSGQIKVDRLILLASGGIRNKNLIKKKAVWLAAKALKAPSYLLPSRNVDKIKTRLYKKMGSDLLLIPHMRQTFLKMVREDIQSAARSVKQPTLLIYGDKDRSTPVSYGYLLSAAIPDSRLVVVKNLGHFLHQEDPLTIAAAIEKFLEEDNA